VSSLEVRKAIHKKSLQNLRNFRYISRLYIYIYIFIYIYIYIIYIVNIAERERGKGTGRGDNDFEKSQRTAPTVIISKSLAIFKEGKGKKRVIEDIENR